MHPFLSLGMHHSTSLLRDNNHINSTIAKELLPALVASFKQGGYTIEEKSFYAQHKTMINCILLAGGVVGSLALFKYLTDYTTKKDLDEAKRTIKDLLAQKSRNEMGELQELAQAIVNEKTTMLPITTRQLPFLTSSLAQTGLIANKMQKQHTAFFHSSDRNNSHVLALIHKIKHEYNNTPITETLLELQRYQEQSEEALQQFSKTVQTQDQEFTEQLEQSIKEVTNLSNHSATIKKSIDELNAKTDSLKEKNLETVTQLNQLERILIEMEHLNNQNKNDLVTVQSLNDSMNQG